MCCDALTGSRQNMSVDIWGKLKGERGGGGGGGGGAQGTELVL